MRATLLLLLAALPALAQQLDLNTLNFTAVGVVNGQPTGITHAGDGSGRLFVNEKSGRIWIVEPGVRTLATPFLDIRSRVGSSGGEQGLFSVAFHPQYASNGRFFVNYTDRSGDTVVSEFRVSADPNLADPASETVFFTADQPFSNHNGGQIQFGPDGMLYIAMGDGGDGGDPRNYAQTLSSPLGKMLRFDVDQGAPARAPADNPFLTTAGAYAGVWSYGLRNPWKFSFDRATGDVWIGDVGQGLWEEVDHLSADAARGANYGWRRMEGRHCYNPGSSCNDGSLVLPVMEYSHSDGACSITGGYRYRGARHPSLDGVYFFADFCLTRLEAGVETSPGVFQRLGPRGIDVAISTFGEDEQGEVYFASFYDGRIFRIDAPAEAPRLTQQGVVDAASFQAGTVAPGSIVSIFGAGLAEQTAVAAGAPLPTQLAGAQLWFTPAGGARVAAPVFFVSPGQANVQVPWELAGAGSAQLTATAGSLESAAVTLAVTEARPGVFTMDQSGGGQAAALIAGAAVLAAPAGSFANARPARLGEYLEVFATGLGPVTQTPASGAASPSGPLAETVAQVRARIGGVDSVPVRFAGLAPGFVGLYQVNIELVGELPSGGAVPLTLFVGEAASNTVTIALE
ncbi:MAG: PQQ-dependent sugar dehydrogenase [Bryobacterales bacterium]|nr:PQQ-dependent sugar dehydrogenase [Bryobacterales bacterium]